VGICQKRGQDPRTISGWEMASEKFCLRWNDFERNISSAFKDIRDEKEFFDITIACEDEQLQAHKVILSACSPFFKKVLCRNHHQHPLLYLKGVSFRDMEAVLNFMYHGEVNVAQDDLNSFLQVAEDLRVKGLTQNNGGELKKPVELPKHEPRTEATNPRHTEPAPPLKRPRPTPPQPRVSQQPVVQQHDDDVEEILPVVKSEPHDSTPTTQHVLPPPTQPVVQVQQQEQNMAMYDDGSQQMGAGMMMTMETEQYDESYGGDYDGQYGDQSYEGEGAGGHEAAGAGEAKLRCEQCEGWFHKRSMARHIERKHSIPLSVSCEMCGKVFTSKVNLKEHYRRFHGLSNR